MFCGVEILFVIIFRNMIVKNVTHDNCNIAVSAS
jgi:hypothetical protein